MNSSMLLSFPIWATLLIIFVCLVAVAVGVCFLLPVKIWFRSLASGAPVSMANLIGMKMRKVDYKKIIDIYTIAQKAGLEISIADVETHLMAGGDMKKVVDALIAARSAKLELTLDQAKAIDLAGRDVVEAVKTSVTPKVIRTSWIEAVAKDGFQVKAIAQVTIKARLDRQIGNADTETILARVGESVVMAIGKAKTHSEVTGDPSIISKSIVLEDLGKQTAYDILSVDVSEVVLGNNVGAKLKIEDAETKKKISQAAAEERKAQAIALEQEMKAKTQEMKAIVLAAESEVHKAMAAAMKNGKFGVMDYYKLQNIVADTNMRNSISSKDGKPGRPGDDR